MQVGAAGTVRESHGHMLGPDEAALIESDDSDKVGYQDGDDGEAPSAEAEAAAYEGRPEGKGSRQWRSTGSPVDGSGGGSSKSKKPKRGLGYKV